MDRMISAFFQVKLAQSVMEWSYQNHVYISIPCYAVHSALNTQGFVRKFLCAVYKFSFIQFVQQIHPVRQASLRDWGKRIYFSKWSSHKVWWSYHNYVIIQFVRLVKRWASLKYWRTRRFISKRGGAVRTTCNDTWHMTHDLVCSSYNSSNAGWPWLGDWGTRWFIFPSQWNS